MTRTLQNYLQGKSTLYKSMTRMAVLTTHLTCALLCLIAIMAESHPVISMILTALFCLAFWLKNTGNKQLKK